MNASYRPTIGLEVHAELSTSTKMFCTSKNNPLEERPNTNVCPVCLAHPGTLPAINKEAVRHVLRVGAALNGELADYTEFDRKSYFYPDIPKGYQISQYEHPLVSGGMLAGVRITRVHLEEDTARSSHAGGASLVDFNRAGIPLMELVTEPVIHDAKTAGNFARELQLLLRTLGASHANLERGEMRIEANISVSKDETFGTKVEIKNLNSFRSVERAIAFEIERQIALLEQGEKISQETRGWDEEKQETFHQRFKEGSADYRYFPEPDLPKLVLSELSEFSHDTLVATLPELPSQTRERYEALGVKSEDIELYLQDTFLRSLFDEAVIHAQESQEKVRLIGNYVVSDIAGLLKSESEGDKKHLTPKTLYEIVEMLTAGEISSRGAKDLLRHIYEEGGSPKEVAVAKGLMQVSDLESLKKTAEAVVAAHPSVVEEYRNGKESVLQFLVGQAMKESKGAGNPALLREVLVEELKNTK